MAETATKLVDAIQLFDVVGYKNPGDTRATYSDGKGTKLKLSQEEFSRLEEIGAVAASGSKAAKTFLEQNPPVEESESNAGFEVPGAIDLSQPPVAPEQAPEAEGEKKE